MKVIIAPTDFSPVSLNAVNYAADMASTIHASLALIYVCPLPMTFSEVPVPADTIAMQINDATKKLDELKKKITLRTEGKIRIYTEIKTGMIMPEISDYCNSLRPYAVVMGTQGAGAVERFIFGSTTTAAIKHLSWPLIVVPAEAKFTAIKKIGLACDLKRVVDTAPLEEIKTLVKEFNASLHVVHINTDDDEKYGPEIVDQSGLLQEMLNDLHPSYYFISGIGVEEGLSSFVEKNHLDLLIMAPKKHNLVDLLFHKRHTKAMVLHTHIPVMAVHE